MPYGVGTEPTVDEWWSFANPYVNGGAAVSLHQQWWSIGTIGGTRFGIPLLRGSNVEVPYVSGQLQRAKYADQRAITLVMWTAGIDQSSGKPDPSDQRTAWNTNWQQLRALFWTRGVLGSVQGTLTRQWNVGYQGQSASMISASALAEVAGTMEPTMTGRTRADFSVDLLLAAPYFFGSQRTVTLARNVAQNVTAYGEGVVGETFPSTLNAFTVTLNGPLTNPLITNSTNGVSVALQASVASGSSVTVDILNRTAMASSGLNLIAYITHAGARQWLMLTPGVNNLELTTGSSSDSGNAVVAWNDHYI
jgi:hypothetical protein